MPITSDQMHARLKELNPIEPMNIRALAVILNGEAWLLQADLLVPSHMVGGMLRYVLCGVPPGDFQRAMYSNDFMEMCRRADDANLHALKSWAIWLYSKCPAGCYGSPEHYRDWIASGGMVFLGVADPSAYGLSEPVQKPGDSDLPDGVGAV